MMKCYSKVDDHRFLLADHLGTLYILMLVSNGQQVTGLKFDVLGEVNKLM